MSLVSFKSFSRYFTEYTFSCFLFLLLFQDSDNRNARFFIIDPQGPETLLIFLSLFFFSPWSEWVNSIVLSLSSLILSLVPCIPLLNPYLKVFVSVIIFFSSKIPICSSLYLLFLC